MPTLQAPKITLPDFIDVLEKERGQGNYAVSGLIIRKSDTSPAIDEIGKQLPENTVVEISKDSTDQQLRSEFQKAFESKTWLVVHLSDGTLPLEWRDQLIRLRNSNMVFIQGKTVEETFFANQPEEMRVVVVIDEKHIESLDYSEFLSLFGPIIEL